MLPFVLFVQFNLAGFLTVRQQLHCHVLRTEAFLIVIVFPDLLDTDLCLFGRPAVLHSVSEGAVCRLGD